MPKQKAFTLVEIIIVVIIVGIILAFGIPNYSRSIRKSDERNMIANVGIICRAIDMYTDNDGPAGGPWNLAQINTNLSLSILDPKTTYSCGTTSPLCTATYPGGLFAVQADGSADCRVRCSAGTCPTCTGTLGSCG